MYHIPEEERTYFPTQEERNENELVSIKWIREMMGEEVMHLTDEEVDIVRDKLYALSNFIYYDWIDSLNKVKNKKSEVENS